jgi:glucose-1-phosphate thymidylyltransferase
MKASYWLGIGNKAVSSHQSHKQAPAAHLQKPMIYYPIELMVDAGIRDILIVTGGNNAGDFLRLLGNGREFGLNHINYTYQDGEGGIAAALSLAEFFADQNPICVILGDNIVEGSISPYVKNFEKQGPGARILLKEVTDPQRFGVPEIKGKQIIRIDEKPSRPASQYAVTDIHVCQLSKLSNAQTVRLRRAEITDVNNCYISVERCSTTYWPDGDGCRNL